MATYFIPTLGYVHDGQPFTLDGVQYPPDWLSKAGLASVGALSAPDHNPTNQVLIADPAGWTVRAKTTEELAQDTNTSRVLLRDSIVAGVQAHLDEVAAARGYGDLRTAPSVSARSYAGYPNTYQAECIVYGQWCAACWDTCYGVLAAVQAGTRLVPTLDDVLAELPAPTWG